MNEFMKYKLIINFVIILCLFLLALNAGDFALINGPHHLYSLELPDGWMSNQSLAQRMKVPAPFFIHPREEPTVRSFIYSYGYEGGDQTLKDYIDTGNSRLKNFIVNIQIDEKTQVKTKFGSTAYIYSYRNYPDKHVEDVAYLKAKNIICVITLSTWDLGNYNKIYGEFIITVKSFYYITDSPASIKK